MLSFLQHKRLPEDEQCSPEESKPNTTLAARKKVEEEEGLGKEGKETKALDQSGKNSVSSSRDRDRGSKAKDFVKKYLKQLYLKGKVTGHQYHRILKRASRKVYEVVMHPYSLTHCIYVYES